MNTKTQQTTQFKNSPLGLIPEDWEVKKVSNFGKVYTGNTPPTNDQENYGNEFMFVSPGDLGISKYILNTEKRLSEKGFLFSRKFKKGSVLFTCIGSTIGKSGIAMEDLTSNQQINAITVNQNNHNEFLFYQLQRNFKQIKLLAGEQAVPIINKSQFEQIKLLCAPLPEQKAIADCLSTWDQTIEKQTALIAQKGLSKKALMQQLLSGKKRLKGFGGKWEVKPLNELLIYTPREVDKPKTPFLALGLRSHGKGVFHKNDFDPKTIAMNKLYVVKENDLVINITFAWEQAFAIATKKDDGGLVSHRFPTYTFNDENTTFLYFKFFILGTKFKSMLDLISPGGAGRNRVMSKKDFLKLEIKLPSVEEQMAIANILECADEEIQLLKKKLDQLKEQKKGLMQVLLTGKKRLRY